MASDARPAADAEPRPSPLAGVVMVLAALAVFGVAYAVGGLFGRQADSTLGDLDARVVSAEEPSGTPMVTISAWEVAFDAREIVAPATQPLHLRLDNKDAGILHNIAVYRDPRAGELVVRGKLFDGPRVRDYRFEPIPPGTYYFQCDLHPSMSGEFRAE